MSRAKLLTADYANKLLRYEPETGLVFWRIPGKGRTTGPIGGRIKTRRYTSVCIEGQRYLLHRVIWLIVNGTWPKDEIDHSNVLESDNSLTNLREATKSQNKSNRNKPKNNTSGLKGVRWNKRRGKWVATIMSQKKSHYLGAFDKILDAHAAYVEAANKLHGAFARV